MKGTMPGTDGEKMAARKEGDGGVGIQKTGVSQSGTPEIRYISTN